MNVVQFFFSSVLNGDGNPGPYIFFSLSLGLFPYDRFLGGRRLAQGHGLSSHTPVIFKNREV